MQYLFEFAAYIRKTEGNILAGEEWCDYYNHMREQYPDVNPAYVLKRLERTGFVNEEMVWADVKNEALVLTSSSNKNENDLAFSLSGEYDYFESMVLDRSQTS